MPIITSVALMIATAEVPCASESRSAESFVMAATISMPFTSTITSAMTAPTVTDFTGALQLVPSARVHLHLLSG